MVHPILKRTLAPLIRLWAKKVNGMGNLKKEKTFIIACNHGSFADDLIIPSIVVPYLNRHLHIYCNDRFYKNLFLRKFLENARCIPVRVGEKTEESVNTNKKAFNLALRYLRNNGLVGIFPEGHRSLDGSLLKAKTGVARLALNAKVPVIPIGTIGSYEIWPKHTKFPRFKRCIVNIGDPMFFDKHYGKEHNRKVLMGVTTKIMKQIAKLTNQEYNH